MDELKEIREALELALREHNDLMVEADLPTGSLKIEKALAALSRLEAREAEAPKDSDAKRLAYEIMAPVALHPNMDTARWDGLLDLSASEIERYVQARIAGREEQIQIMGDRICYLEQAFSRLSEAPKTVPMAMLRELAETNYPDEWSKIASRYGYTITED